jgi:hypothetical protein
MTTLCGVLLWHAEMTVLHFVVTSCWLQQDLPCYSTMFWVCYHFVANLNLLNGLSIMLSFPKLSYMLIMSEQIQFMLQTTFNCRFLFFKCQLISESLWFHLAGCLTGLLFNCELQHFNTSFHSTGSKLFPPLPGKFGSTKNMRKTTTYFTKKWARLLLLLIFILIIIIALIHVPSNKIGKQ